MSLHNFSVPSITVAGVIVPPLFVTFLLLCVSLSHSPDAHATSRVRGACHGGIVPTILRKGTAKDRDLTRYPTFPVRMDTNMALVRVLRIDRLKITDSEAPDFG